MKNFMLMKYILPVALILIIVVSFLLSKKDNKDIKDNFNDTHEVLVQEVIQTKSYTYLQVSENKKNYWMAIMKQPADVGDKFYYTTALEMVDFPSEELDRVFQTIYFVQDISRTPVGQPEQNISMPSMQKPLTPFDADNQIEPIEGGISISRLFENPKEYSGQKIMIRGKVVKVNNEIMGRNWVHIQDGSQAKGNYDLTITTMETVQVGDILSFEGTVVLNKDFGAGYKYDVIIENADIINSKTSQK